MTYDVHAHCIPTELIDMLRRDGSRFGIEIVTDDGGETVVLADRVRLAPFRSILGDMEKRLEAMDKTGVDVQLLSSWIDLTAYALDPGPGAQYSRLVNRIISEEAAKHPDRFLALGTVPLQDPRLAAEELRHAVEELGMVGVEIATTVDGTDLSTAQLEPFWEAAAALRCPILLHPCNPLPGIDLSATFLDNMVGRPAESTIALGHLIFGGILERHPDLVMCVVHGGGFLPYQLGRMERGFTAMPQKTTTNISTSPGELARRLYYDTVLHDPVALSFLVEHMGADRVVVGTDYPFAMGDPDPVATVEAIPGLDQQQRDLILEGNVQRILDGVGSVLRVGGVIPPQSGHEPGHGQRPDDGGETPGDH